MIAEGTLYAIAEDRLSIGVGLQSFPVLVLVGALIITVGAVLYPVDPAATVILLTAPFVKTAVAVA